MKTALNKLKLILEKANNFKKYVFIENVAYLYFNNCKYMYLVKTIRSILMDYLIYSFK